VSVGTRVRALRLSQSISAEQLAVRAGTSSSTVGRLERANIVPNLRILGDIAKALDTTTSALLDETIEAAS
jgi:transcriptional regulator with XRE-family HTH domain